MAKRQIRIPADGIHSRLKVVPDHPATVVLRNGQVFYLNILNIRDLSLLVSDMRNIKKEIEIKDIDEVIIDI